jgi:hypothetical protein
MYLTRILTKIYFFSSFIQRISFLMRGGGGVHLLPIKNCLCRGQFQSYYFKVKICKLCLSKVYKAMWWYFWNSAKFAAGIWRVSKDEGISWLNILTPKQSISKGALCKFWSPNRILINTFSLTLCTTWYKFLIWGQQMNGLIQVHA